MSQLIAGAPQTQQGTTAVPLFAPSGMANDAPSRVLYIPEIVYLIMGFMKRPDNARNARVCKLWSDIALKIVWREVDDLHAVFSVLNPLVKLGNGVGAVQFYVFSELLSVTHWRRFDKYAPFIRKLVYSPKALVSGQKLLSHRAMVQISHTRTRLDIFPNLNTLVWRPHFSAADVDLGSPTLNDGFLFMHAAVTDFTLSHINGHVEPYANHFLREVPLRMPHLTQLHLHTSQPVALMESGLCSLAKHLHVVTIIRLPAYYLTTRVAEALSGLSSLRVISVGHGKPEDVYPEQPGLPFRPNLPADSFKSLRNLSLKMHPPDAIKVVSNMTSLSGMGLLYISFVTAGIPMDFQKLLESCAQKHKTTRCLQLTSARYNIHGYLADGQRNSLELLNLKPLSQLTMLTHLVIEHPSPLSLSAADVGSIVSTLPSLRLLRLNAEPVHIQASPLGLDVLFVIAQHCKHLETLELFVDATLPTEPLPHDASFRTLSLLALGPSVISREACHPVALYLSSLLPPTCKMTYTTWWVKEARRQGHPYAQIATDRFKLWVEVDSLLQLLGKASARFRDRLSMILDE